MGARRRHLLVLLVVLAISGAAAPVAGAAPAAMPEANLTGVVQVVAGSGHTCARLANAQVRCWGANDLGQVGDGTTSTSRPIPTPVQNRTGSGPLVGVAQLVAGSNFTCARLTSQQVRCWGENGVGQLGDGTTDPRMRPVIVKNPAGTGPLTGVTHIAAGDFHACARLTSGQVRCWGINGLGQLGDGSSVVFRDLPVPVLAPAGSGRLTGVTQIDGGNAHTCARLTSGQARCWGFNSSGQLGNGATSLRRRPIIVRDLDGTGPLIGVTQVGTGEAHSCARHTNGRVRCWGAGSFGQLGTGGTSNSAFPTTVQRPAGDSDERGVLVIASGRNSNCVLRTNRGAHCWGRNNFGQAGDGTTTARLLPVDVRNPANTGRLTNVRSIAVGGLHACAVLTNRQVRCWGRNDRGQLGNQQTTDVSLPVPVSVP